MASKLPDPLQQAAARRAAFDRRKFLRGLGACIALPAFESFLPGVLRAAEVEATGQAAVSATGVPTRMGFVYFPNGAIPSAWWPKGEGADFEFSQTMQPLEKLKQHVQ